MSSEKEMLLRMIIRCAKVKKHKPKKVADPKLKVGDSEAVIFAEDKIKHAPYWNRQDTNLIRNSLKSLIS